MRRHRNSAERLRTAVELLPRHTREAMLRGVDSNKIIVGGYVDRDGGICPMLAAHRNGGRTSFASFARAWDAFTGAGRRPRRASRREIRALRTYLEMSLLEDDTRSPAGGSLTAIADQIRAERRAAAERADAESATADQQGPSAPEPIVDPLPADETVRVHDMRGRRRWAWLGPSKRADLIEATIAAEKEHWQQQGRAQPPNRP